MVGAEEQDHGRGTRRLSRADDGAGQTVYAGLKV
jgi:hypothetical protein